MLGSLAHISQIVGAKGNNINRRYAANVARRGRPMIDWLNRNQGFVSALLTFIYVVTTLILAYIALRSTRLAEKQIQLTLDLEQLRRRPYVTFDIVVRNSLVFSTLQNSGQTAALDVKVDVEPQISREIAGKSRESALTKHRIACLAPSRCLDDLLTSGPAFFAQFKEPVFRGRVTYSDQSGHRYDEPVIVDLSAHLDLIYTPDPDIAREIKTVGEAIKGLRLGG